ncbi:snaclec echicetin subunit alpha-like [Biomphalaria glabrata]|uniref:Snaclec echicetin subunit alpha-like n=1 Tax=Biomphalaria glabrata TaxID=6526 RepID=A0A9W2YWZ8_BIOGL|nr:snaclec echicetin subunit alpha-like [Biomphalaria glabrata]
MEELILVFALAQLVIGSNNFCWSENGVNDSIYVNGKCYQLFNIPLSWDDSQNFCNYHFYSGSLAEPTIQSEFNVSTSFLKSASSGAWLGANDITTEGWFRWSTSRLNLSNIDSRWSVGRPSILQPLDLNDCVKLDQPTEQLFDTNCEDQFLPMCQYGTVNDPPIDPCYPLKGAVYSNGKCLQFVNLNKNWTSAQASCSALHPKAKLYEMFTEAERIEVTQYVNASGLYSCE